MTRRLLIAPLAGLLLLASCDHTPPAGILDAIQQAAVRKCGYLPTVKAILALLNAHPNWTNATEVADRICQAVTPAQPQGMIESVPIDGLFVGPR